MGMDVPRTDQARRRRRRWMIAGGVLLVISGITVAVTRIEPAAPTIDRTMVWIDTVKRGEMLRQVRGVGSLVPEQISWITARSAARVDRIVLRPGAVVTPDDVVLVLSSPEVAQAAADAASQLKAAGAELTSLRVQLESGLLTAESTTAGAKADYEVARLRAQVNEELLKKGLVSELETRLSRVTAEQAQARNEIEQKRLAFAKDAIAPQLAVKAAEVDRLRAQARLRQEDLDALNVRAGMAGVLQIVPVDIGAQVGAGTNLARVSDPSHLKAEVRIPETQAKDIQLGLPASIDTRNGIIAGRVSRIDPSVQNGTVTVDVTLVDDLPAGARPDLSIEGTIELQRLQNVLFVSRPAFGQDESTVGLFKLDPNGSYATRAPVRLGRSSINTIEIVSGLRQGDRVILSDTSQWDGHDRLRLN